MNCSILQILGNQTQTEEGERRGKRKEERGRREEKGDGGRREEKGGGGRRKGRGEEDGGREGEEEGLHQGSMLIQSRGRLSRTLAVQEWHQ